MSKLTQAFDPDGTCVFSTPDLLRVRVGGDFYVGQKRYIVSSVVTSGEGSHLMIRLREPDDAAQAT